MGNQVSVIEHTGGSIGYDDEIMVDFLNIFSALVRGEEPTTRDRVISLISDLSIYGLVLVGAFGQYAVQQIFPRIQEVGDSKTKKVVGGTKPIVTGKWESGGFGYSSQEKRFVDNLFKATTDSSGIAKYEVYRPSQKIKAGDFIIVVEPNLNKQLAIGYALELKNKEPLKEMSGGQLQEARELLREMGYNRA